MTDGGGVLQVRGMMWRGWRAGSQRAAGQPSQSSFPCTAGTAMRRCTLAHTPTQALASTSSNLTTPIPCGAARRSTTACTTPGEAALSPSSVPALQPHRGQASPFCRRLRPCHSVISKDKFCYFCIYVFFRRFRFFT